MFVKLDESFKSNVRFDNNNIGLTEGRGNILIQLKNGDHGYIFYVLYVLVMKNNLLNLGQFLEKNYTMRLDNEALYVIDENKGTILKALLYKDRNFKIDIDIGTYKCLATTVIDDN